MENRQKQTSIETSKFLRNTVHKLKHLLFIANNIYTFNMQTSIFSFFETALKL